MGNSLFGCDGFILFKMRWIGIIHKPTVIPNLIWEPNEYTL